MVSSNKEQKYKIVKKLDSGGMAEVFQAELETVKGFKKTVAIKRIRPNLVEDDEKYVRMFMDEAKLSLYLQHANIASVFDVGMSNNSFFIVMEFIEGLNLRSIIELLDFPKLSIPVAVYIIKTVCEALDYAHNLTDHATNHSFNIVHRDISPPNILLSRQGEIKLVDFGLAKASTQIEKSEPGIIKGKYSYLSPEAAAGLEVDHRTDLFASGIILFELLTGTKLFTAETAPKTVENVKKAKVPDLSKNFPYIPKELADIIYKSLARDPEERYQNAGDMEEDLTNFLFSYGTAIRTKDLINLVDEALDKKVKEPSSLIDTDFFADIVDELNKLTSFDEDDDVFNAPGAQPIDLSYLSSDMIAAVKTETEKSNSIKKPDSQEIELSKKNDEKQLPEQYQKDIDSSPSLSTPISFKKPNSPPENPYLPLKLFLFLCLAALAVSIFFFFGN
ncbi:MAG: serine/threonine-protein kinase [Deltaproteobacteria bacterium]|jgi:serine/threonine protein kinase|nr:serine/threonine-protein kinase [Deltaproteobacteria bacterium]